MKCSSCGAEASGRFCSACGQPLEERSCPSCGARVGGGARFCTECGASLGQGIRRPGPGPRPERSTGNPNLGWWAAGVLLVVTLLALGYPALSRSMGGGATVQSAPTGMGSGSGQAGLVDLTTMTLEEQGTILFNRVMSSNSTGDEADVAFFLPKALIIYDQLNPTDADGIYHYALLHQVGGDFESALAKAREGLAQNPDYLLLLAVAAEASAALGDDVGAREMYGRFLEVYDTEMALMRPGYEHHQTIFPVYKEEAEAFLGRS